MMTGLTVKLSTSEQKRVRHAGAGEPSGVLLALKQADHGIPHADLETTLWLVLDPGRGYFCCLPGGETGATRLGKKYAWQFLKPG